MHCLQNQFSMYFIKKIYWFLLESCNLVFSYQFFLTYYCYMHKRDFKVMWFLLYKL